MAAAVLLQGSVVLPAQVSTFSGATLHVYLEDVSRVDTDATVVAHYSHAGVNHRQGETTRLPFVLRGMVVDPQRHYAVRAHVDLRGDGQVSNDSLISMQSYPVLTRGAPQQVTLELRPIE